MQLLQSVIVVDYFFFQAEDGIRDLTVTGVQTCALPISMPALSVKRISAAEPNDSLTRKSVPPPKCAAGLLLLNSSLNPISLNAEAIQKIGRASCRERV